jgi:hypothetical protein
VAARRWAYWRRSLSTGSSRPSGRSRTASAGAVQKAKPSRAAVEIGLEFGLEAGKAVTLIARGTGKANLRVTLEWEHP